MHKRMMVLGAVLTLAACSGRIEQARELLKARAAEKIFIEFRNEETFPRGVVCGEYRTSGPMRGSSRFRRFIVWGDQAEPHPSALDWDIFCSGDQAAALSSRLGIVPRNTPENHLNQIREDLERGQAALQQFQADNYFLPSTDQGLAALVSAASTPPQPAKFRPGGYLSQPLTDPWGRPYHYEVAGLGGGVSQDYRLFTLGADNAVGGKGENADVGLEHLQYLQLLGD